MNHWTTLTNPGEALRPRSYEIVRNMPETGALPGGRPAAPEREAMQQLEVGDGFWITEYERVRPARDARRALVPREFTVRKVPNQGWQVRRIK